MSIYKHIEQGVTTDNFVLSSMDIAPNINMPDAYVSLFDTYPFLYPIIFSMLVVGLLIWIDLLISVFQARFSPHKFISIQLNIVIATLKILCVFLALWLFIILAWKHTFTVYFFIFMLSCLYIKRKETLVKAGCFIITEFLKFTFTLSLLCFSFGAIVFYLDIDTSRNVFVILLTLFMFSPIFISILFRWHNQAYKNTLSIKSVIFTCIGAFTILMIPIGPEIMWLK